MPKSIRCRLAAMGLWLALIAAVPAAIGAQTAGGLNTMPPLPWPPIATFSILGYDPATGEVGGAVQSRVFSVGNGVLWAEAGVGVAATQAIVDVSYGPQAIALLRQGVTPANVIKRVWDADLDPRPPIPRSPIAEVSASPADHCRCIKADSGWRSRKRLPPGHSPLASATPLAHLSAWSIPCIPMLLLRRAALKSATATNRE